MFFESNSEPAHAVSAHETVDEVDVTDTVDTGNAPAERARLYTNDTSDTLDTSDTDDFEFVGAKNRQRNEDRKPGLKKKAHEGKRTLADARTTLLREADASEVQADVFNPTYQGSRHEQEMILSSLGDFYHDHVIADVLRVVKAGKEATVYCCRAHANAGVPLLAAKIYRPRMFRNLKNDAQYRVGTDMVNPEGVSNMKGREKRAVNKRTKVGLNILHGSWLGNEVGVMGKLHKAGAITPKIHASGENAILMEYLGDEKMAAPPLGSVTLQMTEARKLLSLLIDNIKLMLANDVIHGDLSAFNVLYWEGEIRIIDFPQAVSPYKNPNAFKFFLRDVTRICEYFERYDINRRPHDLANALWREVMGLEGDQLNEIQRGRWVQ